MSGIEFLILPVFPFIGLGGLYVSEHLLREKPFESELSKLYDKFNQSRVIYSGEKFDENQFKQEVSKFDSGKAIVRRIGLIIARPQLVTDKMVLKSFYGSEELIEFVNQNKLNRNDGEYITTLRELHNGDYWLHSRLDTNIKHISLWNEIDVRGIYSKNSLESRSE